jgi:hypothetical protein
MYFGAYTHEKEISLTMSLALFTQAFHYDLANKSERSKCHKNRPPPPLLLLFHDDSTELHISAFHSSPTQQDSQYSPVGSANGTKRPLLANVLSSREPRQQRLLPL